MQFLHLRLRHQYGGKLLDASQSVSCSLWLSRELIWQGIKPMRPPELIHLSELGVGFNKSVVCQEQPVK